jgi:hypothetical protein
VRDVFSGRSSPRRFWGFVERLVDEPWSRWRAKGLNQQKWREHLGWGPAEYLSAAVVDALNLNTAVAHAHGSGKRPKQPQPTYRPPVQERRPDPVNVDDAMTLAQIDALMNE